MSLLVAGAGPAGTSAAITAKRLGLDVTLIEASLFPRFRPGESLHPGIEPLLNELDPSGTLLNLAHVRYPGIDVQWGDRNELVPFDADWLGHQIERSDLDNGLLQVARSIGVDVRLGVTAEEVPQGQIIIDATGTASWLQRALGLRTQLRSPRLVAQYGYAEGTDDLEWPRLRADQDGWTWLAQVGPKRFHWTRVTELELRNKGWQPPEYDGMRVVRKGGSDVTWRMAEQLAGPNWFLCGEAAAVLDPSSSHGVLRSIMSGMYAATLAAATHKRQTSEQEAASVYSDWFTRFFEHDAAAMTQAYRDAALFGF